MLTRSAIIFSVIVFISIGIITQMSQHLPLVMHCGMGKLHKTGFGLRCGGHVDTTLQKRMCIHSFCQIFNNNWKIGAIAHTKFLLNSI